MTKTNKLTIDPSGGALNHAAHEEEVLSYWDEIKAFERSVSERDPSKSYEFYDGPPFATGLPHYGHLLASTAKDVVPRYWTMKGYRVERTWGWDCHGIPIENMIEKELGLKGGKKGIEEYGIDKFNAACRAAILRFDLDWRKSIKRLGRWVDMEHSYKTMDKTFMESVWWAFSELYKKDLVYEGRKVILYCPRCSTPLSNFEIAMDNSYKDVEAHSLFVKFKKSGTEDQYFVAWTTTPWTLPGNVGLAVHPSADYVLVEARGEKLWLAEALAAKILGHEPTVVKSVKGAELVGDTYEPLYTYLPVGTQKSYVITAADFVSIDEGTGIVHTAAIYGEDDYQLALREALPTIPMLDDQGKFLDFVTPVAGQFYTKGGEWVASDLETRGVLHHAEKIMHSSPFCYRCGTALYYNAVPAWFINIQKIKPKMVKENENINWYPTYLKKGRFGKGLETAPDWNISRSRYWGTPMPIWKGENTGKVRVIGSLQELEMWAVDPSKVTDLTDIHREFVDEIEIFVDDEKTEKGHKIPDVFDCWIESGSMPYASVHYPMENHDIFESRYPAEYIVEYIAQTRAWFYTLHVMSVAVFGKPSFVNAVTTGTILAEDGTKMSKSKKNYPDPQLVIDKYGVDSLRLYLMSSQVMKAENLNFAESAVDDIRKSVMNIWWNIFMFQQLYGKNASPELTRTPTHVLDRWLVSKLAHLTKSVTESMDNYDVVTTSRMLMSFAKEFSTWYLRLSRDRLRADSESQNVLAYGLKSYALLMSPFTPFMSERVYQNLPANAGLPAKDSVHLEDWPIANEEHMSAELEISMELGMRIVEKGHAARKLANVRLRQPLAKISISGVNDLSAELSELLADELNVKAVETKKGDEFSVSLDTELTDELRDEGTARDIMRDIQGARKAAGLTASTVIVVELPSWPARFEEMIKDKTNVSELRIGEALKIVS